MAGQFIKRFGSGFLLVLVMIFFIVAAGIFSKAPVPAALAKQDKVVLRSLLADRGWYPADANALNKQIEDFYKKAEVEPIEGVIALILPHAGYRYSGQAAASGLKTTDKQYKRIIVIGPSHHVGMEEMLTVPRVTHYETPLGQVPLDVEFIEKLLKFDMFQNVPRAHKNEHSVQIELPLLQYRQKGFKLVPIVAGGCSLETVGQVADILKGLIDQETLVIASSDFTHYGSGYGYVPFKEDIPEQLKKLDMGAYECIAKLDSKAFLEYKSRTGATLCGYVPIAIVLSMLEKSSKAELVKYTTSGELMSDYSNSVSYLCVAFSGKWSKYPEVEPKAGSSELTDEEKKRLLALSRKTIVYAMQNLRVPQISELDVPVTESMQSPRAVFVTLKKNHQLRGCIGDIFPRRPLYNSVIRNTINAAFGDKRFPALSDTEVNDVTIEISALTVPEPIDSSDKIRIGIDGVVLYKDNHSAVFLPQVAPEQGWDCLLYTSPSPRDATLSRMPSSA